MPYIEAYTKADGTYVRGHYRWAAGARHEMAILAMAAVAIVGIGNGPAGTATGSQQSPRPQKTATYPVSFGDSGRAVQPHSQRPVTYPIRFPKVERTPAPRQLVSYPIRFETNGTGR
jgi:hypothetical protein